MIPREIVAQLIAERGDLNPAPRGIQEVITACCFLSILLPAGVVRLSAGPIIFGLYFYILFWTEQQSRQSYLLGVSCTILVYRWLDLVVIHKPERDFWKVEEQDDGTVVQGRAPEGWWPRLKWAFFLWNNQRGVGWNIEPDCLPAAVPRGYSRSQFLKDTFRRFGYALLSQALTNAVLRIGYFYFLSQYPWDDQSYHFFRFPLTGQIMLSWVTAFKLYTNINMLYFALALVTVLLNIYEPRDWPPIFGSFLFDGWSVRNMWGRCWHQMMRRPCSEAGRIVKNIFGFRKGGFMSRYSQIWVGFAVSALAHQAGAKVGMYQDGGYWQAVYFMTQPLAIMFEDGIMALGRRAGVKSSGWTKFIGRAWVFLWFSWTLRFMVAYQPTSWLIDESVIPWNSATIAAADKIDPDLAVLLTAEHWKLRWLCNALGIECGYYSDKVYW
ncbi:uncharacterized protein LY89DRAFT_73285 [Mollisia scopiformis]|uniref:Wax synthase domain-containing protein n=1 Tax=Mollisia scopiformis TaxID=149040 RepID=A0A194XAI4_MOLSC|nr:uncharacterized protein LY89DRAFT_73285 [Mollisia scopiformis]KUJ17180.1 hypothetical protein LY89DRAFT_73285 [Mollisia scopiformis]